MREVAKLPVKDRTELFQASYSGGSTGSSSYHSSSSSYDSYDEGYDDIYMNGDYDYDRYDSDDDYAAGVDDAMDEDYEEW